MSKIKYFYFVSIVFLLLALCQLPYGYYIFLRIWLFGISVYSLSLNEQKLFFLGWIISAVLYNPLIPIYLKRDVWNVLNILTVFFIVLNFCFNKLKEKN